MAFSCGFFNSKGLDRTYTAENFCDYLGSIICDGIQDNYGDCFKLTIGTKFQVTLGKGKAWLKGHYFINDASYNIDLSGYQDESLPRLVAISILCDSSESVRNVKLEITPGTPAEYPILPTFPPNENKTRLILYSVRLDPDADEIQKNNISDYREDKTKCGYCRCILGKCKVTDMLAQLAQITADIQKYNEIILTLTNEVENLKVETENIGNVTEAGQCGKSVYYVLYSNGTLLLSGSGATYDYTGPLDKDPNNSVFYDNQKIKKVVISGGVTALGEDLFRYCNAIETVSFPNTLTSIGRMAFFPHQDDHAIPTTAYGLTSLDIPPHVTSIGYCAFNGTRISEVTIPHTVTSMGERVFQSCVTLKEARFEAAEIPQFTFTHCTHLTKVTLAKTVKKIGSHWINYCDRLTEITYEGSIEDWGKVEKMENWDGNQTYYKGNMKKIICLDGYMEYKEDKWIEVKTYA